ncbi:histone-lysine N-methyltransferase SETD2 [Chanos chanos]|uniref:[histone H3]-lysine(36) N-trimethyltransferase n=1 Tax=Chanos chanos TaxID=29144 RepID=A0A6J2W1B8_CHACN|nr:histone-lysine N-methyltransferase SETD2 [Chanos chanos]
MDAVVNSELREEAHDGSINVESLPKQVIFKSLAPRVVLSNRLLPKGTKTKVNLEEQGRQKVSFSLNQIKTKPRQNVFLSPPSPEKTQNELSSPTLSVTSPTVDLVGQFTEGTNEEVDAPVGGPVMAESQTHQPSVSLLPKCKVDLGRMHFKKQILSVSVPEECSTVGAVPEEPSTEQEVFIRSLARIETETSTLKTPQNIVSDGPSENVCTEEKLEVKQDSRLKGPVDYSHIGKENKGSSSTTDHDDHKKVQSQSDSILPSSESDGDSVQTSSSHKSSDPKNLSKSDNNRHKDTKRTSSGSKVEEMEKSSRSEKRDEKDDRISSRSKSERDSRHTSSRSSRSDRDRRRSRSRSRSRSRGSRTSSSYSRSERSRSDRESRSDRSHYHDSERRSHRSPLHRERRSSRSRTDGRSRDSSDSEDDHRRTRTRGSDSSRTSTHSSSQRDSKSSSYSKSHRDSKSKESSSRSSESDKRTQYSKSERSSGRTADTEPSRRSSPEADSVHRKLNARPKSDANAKSTNSSPVAVLLSSEKKTQKSSGSSDSDEEHKRTSRSQGSDKSSGSCSSSSKKDHVDSKLIESVPGADRQSAGGSPSKKQTHPSSGKDFSQRESVKVEAATQHVVSSQKEMEGHRHPTTEQGPTHGLGKSNVKPLESSLQHNQQEPPLDSLIKRQYQEDQSEKTDYSNLVKDTNDNDTSSAFETLKKYNEAVPFVPQPGRVTRQMVVSPEATGHHSADSKTSHSGSHLCENIASSKIDKVSSELHLEGQHKMIPVQNDTGYTAEQVNVAHVSTSEHKASSGLDEPAHPDLTPCQDSFGSQSGTLSVKESQSGEHLKLNANPMHSIGEVTNRPSCTNLTPTVGSSCKVQNAEQLNLNNDPCNAGSVRKSSMKKSRWDIVGQDTSETDSLQKRVNRDATPPVKKVISVKRIEFNSDPCFEDPCLKKNNFKQDAETHSKKIVEVQKGDLSIAKSPGRSSGAHTEPFDLKTQRTGEFSSCHLDVKTNSNEIATDSVKFSCPTGPNDFTLNQIDENLDESQKPRQSEVPVSDNPDSRCHSEDSESEDSESDSDDGTVSMKRLHSVVVVPKKSNLTLESKDQLETSGSPSRSNHADDGSKAMNRETSSSQSRHGAPSTVLSEGSKKQGVAPSTCGKHHSVSTAGMTYQSQSNMVDSTSHSEATNALPHHTDRKNSAHERPKMCGPVNQEQAPRLNETDMGRRYDKPDSWHSRKDGWKPYGNFSILEHFNSQDAFSQGVDFNQPEQPSSTFQQPDSSHATVLHPAQSGSVQFDHVYRQGNGHWTQPAASHVNRPVYVPVPYHDSVGQIHPDSLTNDHGEDYERRTGGVKHVAAPSNEPPASSTFVQAHEISSNCSFAGAAPEHFAATEARREELLKPHKGRGPPKKRRPEIESDSDNEAEPGLANKRERMEECEASRDSKTSKETSGQSEEEERPLLSLDDFLDPVVWKEKAKMKKMPPYFDLIEENMYLTERKKNKSHRDIKRMQCECAVLSREERARGMMACGDDCLNRLLMIECSSRCLNGSYCSNRRFQMKQHAEFEVILTENKGWGLRAAKDLPPNTFVLEYCGEVLDHREFKSRVKEYARSKNIHYYFMALKNNEIIDATLKGNCSRFMNHSCEPNCETQKWTVNGQLRVGFFTTKAVKAGTELTFDYQFQRYGKEAQRCLCGTPSCRGFLGGENRVSVRAAGGKMKKERSRKKDTVSALTTVDEELEALLENGEGLSDEKEVISLCRLMVRVETMEQRLTCVKLIQNTQNPSCLKQFLDHHGLSLLWIFMVELSEAKGNSVNNIKLQLEIMKALAVLPISTKNMLEESRVLQFIQRWAQNRPLPQAPEQDGYSSESTSRAQTPLNTPDGPPAKLVPELDSETPKRAVYRRLKIISENSLDSALSDASKASDGKEEDEEDEEEEEMEDDGSQTETTVGEQVKAEAGEAAVVGGVAEQMEVNRETSEATDSSEVKTESEETGKSLEERSEEQAVQERPGPLDESQPSQAGEKVADETTPVSDESVELDSSACQAEPSQTEASTTEQFSAATEVKAEDSISVEELPSVQETPVPQTSEESTESSGPSSSPENESSEPSAFPTGNTASELPSVPMESTPSDSTVANTEAASSESSTLSKETTPPVSSITPTENTPSEVTPAAAETSAALTTDVTAVGSSAPQAEGVAVGTPSQDEEEGVSDVESERSQEPQVRAADISDMAARLLESWKDLKEVYRIPKKSQVEKDANDRSRDRDALLTPRAASGSRERDRDKDRDRDRDWERDRDWDRDRDGDRSTLRSGERRRRRPSASPPPAFAYERSSRWNEDRFAENSNSKKKSRTKERNKLSTEERRKLFEQEVAQREAQKQQQQQQLQTLAFDPLAFSSSPHGFLAYPPGYPIQTYVDPTNPNAGKVLLPTPAVEPLCPASAALATVPFEQTPPQRILSDLALASPSSTTQGGAAASLPHMPASLELASGAEPFAPPAVATQDPGVAVLSVPAPTANPQVQGTQTYTPLWEPSMQQTVTVQTQPAQQYSTTAQPQTAIYYPGQPCQTIYSIPAAYPQANTPVIQTYTEPTASYLHSQQVYAGHQQGVVVQQGGTVTTIVTSQTVQQELVVPNSIMDLPPPSPPKPKTIVLPPNWKVARDPEGKIYYYHVITRQTQWDPPSWDGASDDTSVDHEAEMDLGTPTYDENPSKFSTKTAEADTSSELAKKSKEVFRKEMSQFIVQCLNPYRKPDCKLGRIGNTEDFKHLARKLTHGVMNKELKSCKNPEDLECNENVKHKTKEYIKKYMQKFGPVYRPKEDTEMD